MRFERVHIDLVDSTQDEALRLILSGRAHDGTVVTADIQTKGRGRQGRKWETDRADAAAAPNLAATLVCRLPQGARAGDYSLLTAVALHDAILPFLDPGARANLRIKWPNDLLLNGVKCAGILLESPEPGWVLIGTGVNIAHAPPDRACLYDAAGVGARFTRDELLDAYLTRFAKFREDYTRSENGLADIVAIWMQHAHGVGQGMTVRTGNEEFQSVFDGLDPQTGACRARLSNGEIRLVHAGEVFFG